MAEGALMTLNGDSAGLDTRFRFCEQLMSVVPRIGLVLTVFAALFSATSEFLTSAYIFRTSTTLTVANSSLITHSIHAMLIIPYVSRIRSDIDISRTAWKCVSLSAACQALGIVILPAAVLSSAAGDAATVRYTVPVALVISTAWYFLCEIPSILDIVCAFGTIGGAVLVAQPVPIFGGHLLGVSPVAFTTIAVTMLTIANMIVRHVRNVRVSVIFAVHSIGCMLISVVATVAFGQMNVPASSTQWLVQIAASLLTFAARLCILTALTSDLVVHVTLVTILQLAFSLFFKCFLYESMHYTHIVGLVLLFLVTVLVLMANVLNKFFENTCGRNISTYEQTRQENRDSDEAIALRGVRTKDSAPSLYTLD